MKKVIIMNLKNELKSFSLLFCKLRLCSARFISTETHWMIGGLIVEFLLHFLWTNHEYWLFYLFWKNLWSSLRRQKNSGELVPCLWSRLSPWMNPWSQQAAWFPICQRLVCPRHWSAFISQCDHPYSLTAFHQCDKRSDMNCCSLISNITFIKYLLTAVWFPQLF